MTDKPESKADDSSGSELSQQSDGVANAPPVSAIGATPQPFQTAPIFVNPLPFPGGVQLGLNAQVQVWQGQFPPPEAIERYERVLPGTFDRLVSMAERQQQAVIDSTADARSLISSDTKRGHWLGWSVTVGSILGAAVCAYFNHDGVAIALVAVPVMSVAKALIDSSRAKPSAVITGASPNPAPPKTTPGVGGS